MAMDWLSTVSDRPLEPTMKCIKQTVVGTKEQANLIIIMMILIIMLLGEST